MSRLQGVIAAVLTPVTESFSPDGARAAAYYRWLLDNGCDGLNVLGTTGEAMSFSAGQRIELMQGLSRAGLPLERMMVGTGSASLADTTELTKHALDLGFGGVLLMPPFFYRDAHSEGLTAYFAALQRAAHVEPNRLYLYNFPKMSGVTFTVDLVRRVQNVIPVAGLKDSSNDLTYESALREAFPSLHIFPSSEAQLREAKGAGFAGCISGTVALWPHFAGALWNRAHEPRTEPLQDEVTAMRAKVTAHPLIAAARFLTALQQKDATWEHPVPPLEPLNAAGRAALTVLAG
ncbi:MAG: dihydrodipicolinate synthase family protein [Vulcanimicrobiaceae bacterium]